MNDLTPKERRFVSEYMVDLNGTKAAVRAGFAARSAGVTASRLLKKPKIARAIEAEQQRLADMTGITAARVLNELALLGFANMADYVTGEGEGRQLDLTRASRDQMAAVSEYTVESFWERTDAGKPREVRRIKMKLHDKKGALVDIGRHLGMFAADNKREVELTDKTGDDAKAELTRRYDRLAATAGAGEAGSGHATGRLH
jgi:phage terminase small subunit